jgi:hypothetical protein
MATSRDIAIFYSCIGAVLFLLRMLPRSWLSRLAFTWLGPAPRAGELKSHYLWRWAGCAFTWFSQFLAVLLAGLYFAKSHVNFFETPLSQAVFWFCIPMLGLVALAGAILAALAATKSMLLGPNPKAGQMDA